MIINHVDYASDYFYHLPHFKTGLETLRQKLAEGLPCGVRCDFEGGYLTRFQNHTKPAAEAAYEAHKKYIDVQLVLDGREKMAWERLERMTEDVPYSEEKDVGFYKPEPGRDPLFVDMKKDTFCILYPTDAHAPFLHMHRPTDYDMVIIKLAVDFKK